MKTMMQTAMLFALFFCPVAAAGEIPVRIEERTLGNGLKVIAARF